MLELTLRSTVILVAAWTLTRLMPRATSATRHLVWHGALLAIVLAPLVSLANVPKLPVVPEVTGVELAAVTQIVDALEQSAASTAAAASPTSAPVTTSAPVALSTVATAGTLALTLWFAAGWIVAARMARCATPAPAAWQLELNTLCGRLKIDREVRLRIIDRHVSPLATGLRHAVILLPRTAVSWSDDRRRAVLLHELAHIQRRDCHVQLVAQIACAMYWFNPLVWHAASELRSERERACDDQVLRLGAQASSYAAHLLDIARELRPTLRPSTALAMARPSELEGRLLSVLATGRARAPFRATRWLVVSVLTATTVVALGATAKPAPVAVSLTPTTVASAPRYVFSNDVVTSSLESPPPRAKAEATIQESTDPEDRELATLALAFTSGRDVIPALLKALRDTDSQVREKAAIGLALRKDERVIAPLIAAMSDPDSQVREKVAIALGTTGDERAQNALTRALDDPDAQVREKAAAALILFGLTK